MTDTHSSKTGGTSPARSSSIYREVVELSGDLVFSWDANERLLYASPAASAWFQVSVGAPLQDVINHVYSADRQQLKDGWMRVRNQTGPSMLECRVVAQDGTLRRIHWHFCPVLNEEGQIQRVHAVGRDVTQSHDSHEGLSAERRSEAIIQLARGLSHDFNNMLVSVLGNASVLAGQLSADHPWWPIVNEIIEGADRAAELTRNLLTYARSTRHAPQRRQLGELLDHYLARCRGLLEPNVKLEYRAEAANNTIEADPPQLEQAILNLVLNAAESMPGGGTVSVRTANEEFPATSRAAARNGVTITIEDTGVGMTPEVRQRMFDPYFSTKGAGRGLGLAVVQGVVQAHKGILDVESEPGRGTRVRLLLPLAV